jgi:hypothetical protein
MPILFLIEKEEGPTLFTLCNNQNFYFLLFTFYFSTQLLPQHFCKTYQR